MQNEDTSVFTLRLLGKSPAEFPMERLAEYMRLYAKLLGGENHPVFSHLEDKSTALVADTPASRATQTDQRLRQATNDPKFEAYKYIKFIETEMSKDDIPSAELKDSKNNVIYLFKPAEVSITHTVIQSARIDGEIVGVVGADDTMHVSVREYNGRVIKLLADIATGRELAIHLRIGTVRLQTFGTWNRTEHGWVPDSKKCKIQDFLLLEDIDVVTIFNQLRSIPNNGWNNIPDPEKIWKELRGLDEADFANEAER